MILCFDTETSGLPLDNQPPDHPLQPHLVQLAAVLYEEGGRERGSLDVIIAPEGRYSRMDEKAIAAHGITMEFAQAYGVALGAALPLFYQLAAKADSTVGHNIAFDDKIMDYALVRLGRRPTLPYPKRSYCTMTIAAPVMQLPPTAKMQAAGFTKFKPPNLSALYQFLFNEEFQNAHSAMADCRAAARCFFELRKRGYVT